jgi:DNA adenine methylase
MLDLNKIYCAQFENINFIIGFEFHNHDTYIELFFGAGGLYFNKPKAEYNILNDISDNVINFWLVMQNDSQREILFDKIINTPYSQSIYKYFKKNKYEDNIMKALRFLYLTDYGIYGTEGSIKIDYKENCRQNLINKINKFNLDLIDKCTFVNMDFRDVIKSISIDDKSKCFIYADPPYLENSGRAYKMFKKNDFIDLLEMLNNSKIKYAISEFDNPFILDTCKDLNIITIGERLNVKNYRTEILITNYEVDVLTLF